MIDKRMWKNHDLEKSYDVVIIGAGAHGLATAYYLTKLALQILPFSNRNLLVMVVQVETLQFFVQIIEQRRE